jgi:hypothetical protein
LLIRQINRAAMSDDIGKTEHAQKRSEHLKAEAEACERAAKKAGSATAMFTLLDLAADLREKAAQAAAEEQKEAPE